MTLMNRLAIKAKCDEIEEAVGKQDISMLHEHGGVRVVVLGGKHAEDEHEFVEALKAYASGKRRARSPEELAQVKAEMLLAIDQRTNGL